MSIDPVYPIVLVTGSTDGIGKETALELGQRGCQVFVHARSLERGQAALADLRGRDPQRPAGRRH